jgi:hypothetical protein
MSGTEPRRKKARRRPRVGEVDESGEGHHDESELHAQHEAAGAYKAGAQAQVEVVLVPKGEFHCNDKYPYKFKTKESTKVSFPMAIVKKDQTKIETMKMTMPIAFTAAEAGKKRVSDVFHFSVCTDDKCLIKKRPLASMWT